MASGSHQEGRHSEQTGQTTRRAPGDNQKHERSIRQHGESRGASAVRKREHVGGQGMGQGRGMNPGEIHHEDE